MTDRNAEAVLKEQTFSQISELKANSGEVAKISSWKKKEKMDKPTKNMVMYMYNSLFRCYVDDFAFLLSFGNYKTRTKPAIDLIIDFLFHLQE